MPGASAWLYAPLTNSSIEEREEKGNTYKLVLTKYFHKIKSVQHTLVALQYEKASSYSILIHSSDVPLHWIPEPSPRSPPSAMYAPASNESEEQVRKVSLHHLRESRSTLNVRAGAAVHYMELQQSQFPSTFHHIAWQILLFGFQFLVLLSTDLHIHFLQYVLNFS